MIKPSLDDIGRILPQQGNEAAEAQKIARFIDRIAAGRVLGEEERAGLAADAHRRLAMQADNVAHVAECLVISNDDGLESLEKQVDAVWSKLREQKR